MLLFSGGRGGRLFRRTALFERHSEGPQLARLPHEPSTCESRLRQPRLRQNQVYKPIPRWHDTKANIIRPTMISLSSWQSTITYKFLIIPSSFGFFLGVAASYCVKLIHFIRLWRLFCSRSIASDEKYSSILTRLSERLNTVSSRPAHVAAQESIVVSKNSRKTL